MSVSMEDPNGSFEFVKKIGLDKYGTALGHFDKMLAALGVQKRTTDQFMTWLKTRPDIATYTPNPDFESAVSPHEAISWATGLDGSLAGVVLSNRKDGKVLLIGSVPHSSGNQKDDATHIAAWGTKVTAAELKGWLELLEGDGSE